MEPLSVICPTCMESFEVPPVPASETPCEIDYDCEICCRPMVVSLETDGDEVYAVARGIHD